MGTSSPYGGPRPHGDLLPPDAPPPPEALDADEDDSAEHPPDLDSEADDLDDQDTTPSPAWDQTKSAMTRFSGSSDRTSSGAMRNLGKAVSGFVRSQGGSRGALASSPSARSVGRAIGGFVSEVARRGVVETIRGRGLDQYLGRSSEVLISALVDHLVEQAGHSEDDLARRAMTTTLIRLFEADDGSALSIDALANLSEQGARQTIEIFVAEYIQERLMHTLGRSVEIKAADEADALAIETEVRDFVQQRVQGVSLDADLITVDWEGREGEQIIDSLFFEAYEILEVE